MCKGDRREDPALYTTKHVSVLISVVVVLSLGLVMQNKLTNQLGKLPSQKMGKSPCQGNFPSQLLGFLFAQLINANEKERKPSLAVNCTNHVYFSDLKGFCSTTPASLSKADLFN